MFTPPPPPPPRINICDFNECNLCFLRLIKITFETGKNKIHREYRRENTKIIKRTCT